MVRTDLGMSRGKTAVQVAHGAVSASERAKSMKNDVWRAWFHEGQKKVALKVETEDEIKKLISQTIQAGIPYAMIKDAGMTELPPGTITVVGIGPAKSDEIDKITGALKLL